MRLGPAPDLTTSPSVVEKLEAHVLKEAFVDLTSDVPEEKKKSYHPLRTFLTFHSKCGRVGKNVGWREEDCSCKHEVYTTKGNGPRRRYEFCLSIAGFSITKETSQNCTEEKPSRMCT